MERCVVSSSASRSSVLALELLITLYSALRPRVQRVCLCVRARAVCVWCVCVCMWACARASREVLDAYVCVCMTSFLSEKILINNQVCITFKTTYFEYKAKAATECPSNPWRFQVYIYDYVHVFFSACMHAYVSVYVYIHTYIHVSVYVYIHTYIHT